MVPDEGREGDGPTPTPANTMLKRRKTPKAHVRSLAVLFLQLLELLDVGNDAPDLLASARILAGEVQE